MKTLESQIQSQSRRIAVLENEAARRPAIAPGTVTKHRFLFELHHAFEQMALDAARKSADALTPAEIVDPANLNLAILRNAEARMAYATEVQLASPATLAFLTASKELGVYGPDPDLAELRIAAILANQLPPDEPAA